MSYRVLPRPIPSRHPILSSPYLPHPDPSHSVSSYDAKFRPTPCVFHLVPASATKGMRILSCPAPPCPSPCRAIPLYPGSTSSTKGYEELWKFVEKAQPLDTTKLQPFEGSDIKWQARVKARHVSS